MKKIIPVSLLAIWVACPAFTENFPNDGYMLENKTYDNAATYDNMGVYEDYVDAIAEYDDCPANSYCDSSGQHSCPSGYPNSAVGSSADTNCYKACAVSAIAHATAVSGNDYYGNGADTCGATACEDGYHTESGVPDLLTIIGNSVASDYIFKDHDDWRDMQWNIISPESYGLTDDYAFLVDFGNKGVIRGHARCSTMGDYNRQVAYANTPEDVETANNVTDETGSLQARNCWCRLESYTPNGGSTQSFTAPWVFVDGQWEDGGDCMTTCESECGGYLARFWNGSDNPATVLGQTALLMSVPSSGAVCAANTITINWSDVDGEDNPYATSVTYDGDITTPVKAATKPGKTFVGWKFAPVTPVLIGTCSSNQDCRNSGMGNMCENGICRWQDL